MVEHKILFDDERDGAQSKDDRISSLDILQHRFSLRFRGYDSQEVDAFLESIALEIDRLADDKKLLQEEINVLKQEIEVYREKEKSINDALLSAKRIGEDMRENAQKEALLIVSGAQLDAEKVMQEAQRQHAEVQGEIIALKNKRTQLEAALRSLLNAHMSLLDGKQDT